jgi:tetratricopeptide (TPR) repeat protein
MGIKRFFLTPLVTLVLAAGILSAQQAAPGNKNASSTQPAGKRPPQAKTQAEFADYNAASAMKGGAAMEKAADDFAAKYPGSELKPYLYAKAMHEYQVENDSPKMLAMGEKVLALDPDNTVALVITATVLSDTLTDTNPDQQKVALIRQRSNHALETADTALVAATGIPQDQVTAYKNTLRSMAHSALAITSLKSGDNADAEKEFKIAADLGKAQPDPFIWYHLALSQDRQGTAAVNTEEQQKKYSEALVSVREALRYTASNPELGKLAEGELKRLLQLTGQESGTTPAAQPQPSPSQQQR